MGSGLRHRKPLFPLFLRFLGIALVVTALARPQTVDAEREFFTEGVDIVLALDVSGSMQAEDFHPENRLNVAKEEAKRFIEGRKHDRM